MYGDTYIRISVLTLSAPCLVWRPLYTTLNGSVSPRPLQALGRDVRPSEGFLVLCPGGGKEERATRGGWGRRGSMSRTGSQYSSPARDQVVNRRRSGRAPISIMRQIS